MEPLSCILASAEATRMLQSCGAFSEQSSMGTRPGVQPCLVTWRAECLQSSKALSHPTDVAEQLLDRLYFSSRQFRVLQTHLLQCLVTCWLRFLAELSTLLPPLVLSSVDFGLSCVTLLQCLGK